MQSVTNTNLIATAIVLAIAAGVPAFVPRLPLPGVVLEILLGAVVGPQILGLVHPLITLDFLAAFGLSMVLLMAGFEMDLPALRGKPIRLAVSGWLISCAIAFAAAYLLTTLGFGIAWSFTGLVLTTTAIGVLLPILRDTGLLQTPYGPFILAAGAAGEAGPIIGLGFLLAGSNVLLEVAIMAAFAAVAVAAIILAARARHGAFATILGRTIETSGQLPVRLTIVLLMLFSVLTNVLHIEMVLGAFIAGIVARAAVPQHRLKDFGARLDGIGSAFLVPVFFVTSGTRLDVTGLLANSGTMALVPVYALLMLAARGIPVFLLYRKALPRARLIPLALHSGTQLSLVVAITGIAVAKHAMPADQATALVFAGILTVILFPTAVRLS